MFGIVGVILLVIEVLSIAILASVVISWLRFAGVRINPYHPVIEIIEKTADLILRPIRRSIPTAGGGLDFSPMVAIIVLQIIAALVQRLPLR